MAIKNTYTDNWTDTHPDAHIKINRSEEDWAALETYVRASNPEDPESGEFYVRGSSRIYRIKMDQATAPAGGLGIEDQLIPKAKPLNR